MRVRRTSYVVASMLSCALAARVALAQGYEGVVPGQDNAPAHLAGTPGGGSLVTWPGFQMTQDGGSRVFVQTTSEVAATLKREGRRVVVNLGGVVLPAGNSRRPLITEFFNTPVKQVKLRKRRGSVALVLVLRADAEPKLTTAKGPKGYWYTYLTFPAGKYL